MRPLGFSQRRLLETAGKTEDDREKCLVQVQSSKQLVFNFWIFGFGKSTGFCLYLNLVAINFDRLEARQAYRLWFSDSFCFGHLHFQNWFETSFVFWFFFFCSVLFTTANF